jgi:hypothetical protein
MDQRPEFSFWTRPAQDAMVSLSHWGQFRLAAPPLMIADSNFIKADLDCSPGRIVWVRLRYAQNSESVF